MRRWLALALVAGCRREEPDPDGKFVSDWSREILSTDLAVDLASLDATATLRLGPGDGDVVTLEAGDLAIHDVTDGSAPLAWERDQRTIDVVTTGDVITVHYTIPPHENFDGWSAKSDLSFLWPRFCGNLFPCRSDPSDGLTFTLEVTGVPAGRVAVFPAAIPADAPSYMPAVAVAAYDVTELGTTTAGTTVKLWTTPDIHQDALAGTATLIEAFEFLETTYGPYTFGSEVGSVSADWGGGDFGGMEHHPFWHVSSGSMYDADTHIHEAAHGWYGNGVRIACWEDFVLSEGTVTYMSLRINALLGNDLWPAYEEWTRGMCGRRANTIVLPDETCNAIDLVNDPLWSNAPYFKGAFFYRDVAALMGAEELDLALAAFYAEHVGGAARMQQMVDHLEARAPEHAAAIDVLAVDWLRTLDCPAGW